MKVVGWLIGRGIGAGVTRLGRIVVLACRLRHLMRQANAFVGVQSFYGQSNAWCGSVDDEVGGVGEPRVLGADRVGDQHPWVVLVAGEPVAELEAPLGCQAA
jgi:hypothetical protein